MKNPVLILKTSKIGPHIFDNVLSHRGLHRGTDYVTFSVEDTGIVNAVQPGAKQMLITGTIRGDSQKSGELVSKCKERNPQLVVVCFCTENIPGCDIYIDWTKDDQWMDTLVKTVREFHLHEPISTPPPME